MNAAYVTVTQNPVASTVALDQPRRIDYDAQNQIVGFEFLDIAHGVDVHGLPFQPRLQRLFGDHHIPVYA